MRKPKSSKALLLSNAGVTISKENIVSGNLGVPLQHGPTVRNTLRAEWRGGKDDILNDGRGDDNPNQRHRRRQCAGRRPHPCYEMEHAQVKNISGTQKIEFAQLSGTRLAVVCSGSVECPTS